MININLTDKQILQRKRKQTDVMVQVIIKFFRKKQRKVIFIYGVSELTHAIPELFEAVK